MTDAHDLARMAVNAAAVPVPASPAGVYVLLNGEAIQYVGMSGSPLKRITQHAKQGRIPFDRYWVRECESDDDARRVEKEMIQQFAPPSNVAHKPRPEPEPIPAPEPEPWHVLGPIASDRHVGTLSITYRTDMVCLLEVVRVRKGDEYVAEGLRRAIDSFLDDEIPGAIVRENAPLSLRAVR